MACSLEYAGRGQLYRYFTRLYDFLRFIVSAPYGQASNAVLQRTDSDDPTGVIYTCPIIPGRCEGITGNGNGDDRRLYDVDGEYLNLANAHDLYSN